VRAFFAASSGLIEVPSFFLRPSQSPSSLARARRSPSIPASRSPRRGRIDPSSAGYPLRSYQNRARDHAYDFPRQKGTGPLDLTAPEGKAMFRVSRGRRAHRPRGMKRCSAIARQLAPGTLCEEIGIARGRRARAFPASAARHSIATDRTRCAQPRATRPIAAASLAVKRSRSMFPTAPPSVRNAAPISFTRSGLVRPTASPARGPRDCRPTAPGRMPAPPRR